MAALPIHISEDDRILIIAPHPDDECIGVGGLLAKYPNLCDIVVMTDGRCGGNNTLPQEECKTRKQQFENEMEYIKTASYKWMGYADGTLMYQELCMEQIKFSEYTKVFLPKKDDNHPDHTAAFMYAVKKMQEEKLIGVEVFQYEVHLPFQEITDFLDITSHIDEKVRLIQFHEDQVNIRAYDMLAKSLGKYRACQMNQPERYYETYLKTDISKVIESEALVHKEKTLQKYQFFYNVLSNWVKAYIEGKNVSDYLIEKEVQRVVIYGYANLGKILYQELSKTGIFICSVLDKRIIDSGIDSLAVVHPADGDRGADAVVVTVMLGYDNIKMELGQLGYHNIYCLSEIIEELCRK